MTEALAKVTAALDNAEERVGQQQMAALVADAIASKRHLVVQAGTGTGKTLAYLVPAIEADARVVVATATKALQDQLATKDLPFLAEHIGRDFDWAVLKGRSNYVCLQRLREMSADDQADHERTKKLLDRVGKAIIMASETETSEIIRRRLFEWDSQAIGQGGKVILNRDALTACNEYADWVVAHRHQVPGWLGTVPSATWA